jgi:2-keto-3-deoxy-L-rhamnonate aldolase RhmA
MDGMNNINNSVKVALLTRQLTIGGWVQLGHAGIAEIFGGAGFDWVCLDLEHGDCDESMMATVFRGLSGFGAQAFARVRSNDTLAIRRAADLGAAGVIVPLVNSAEEARRAVAAIRYPPDGVRGFAFCRANDWGVQFDSYAAGANSALALVVMIESRQAVENIDEILSVEGVDGVFVGPYDMSGSYGIVGQTDHPIIREACKTVSEACSRHGKSAGMHIVQPSSEAIARAISDGFTFVALGMDTVFLVSGARKAILDARRA